MTRWEIFKHNAWQVLVSIDQALHNIGGAMWAGLALILVKLPTDQTWADETLSSRCHRWRLADIAWPAKLIDTVFWWDKKGGKGHCELSWESERNGRQLPPELRN